MLDTLVTIAEEAAKLVMEVYATPFTVDYKGPSDPVTLADRRANAHICSRLQAEFPKIPIVAEESPREDWADYQSADKVFFVDPVDGTREFVAKNGQFVVMIGLLQKDSPTHGVLFAPALNELWAGEVGRGAYRRGPDGKLRELAALVEKPIEAATVVASRSRRGRLSPGEVTGLGVHKVITIGSAGLKGAAVADGRADLYFARRAAGCLWDTCAPEAIVRSLGGIFSNSRGEAIDYRSAQVELNSGAVAGAVQLHQAMLHRLQELNLAASQSQIESRHNLS